MQIFLLRCCIHLRKTNKFISLLGLLAIVSSCFADLQSAFGEAPKRFIVTLTSKLDQGDTRHNFERELVVLLLEKTKAEFGTYETLDAPPMSYSRALLSLKENTYPNYIRGFVYDSQNLKDFDLGYIPFPVLRGLLDIVRVLSQVKYKTSLPK